MSEMTRRRLLWGAAFLGLSGGAAHGIAGSHALSTGAGAPGSPDQGLPSNVEDVWTKLFEQRRKLRSFRATLEMEYTEDSGTSGESMRDPAMVDRTTEIYYSAGKYRLVHRADAGTGIEIFDGTWYVQWFDPASPSLEPRVVREGPPGPQRRPTIPLESILPLPEDKPMSYLGHQTVDGRVCHVILQSEHRFYVRSDRPRVQRVDLFFTKEHVGRILTYERYRRFDDGIELPTLVRVQEMTRDGNVARVSTTNVRDVEVNPDLNPELFAIEGR